MRADKKQMPGTDQLGIAVEWLRNNEGDQNGEAEACKAVADWIESEEFERYLRYEARAHGLPVAAVRRKLAERTNAHS